MKSLPHLSVNNPILVNLMMISIILGGAYCSFSLVKEMFPESRPNQVVVFTPYPGATPAEVEKGISIKIEEAVKDVEGIEDIDTVITEGASRVIITCFNDVEDIDQVVTDVKNAIDSIPRDDFPEEAEETVVSRFEPQIPVISVAFYGDMSDEQLKTMGRRVRDDILALPGLTDVVLSGTRIDEISVNVDPEKLVRYNLSFPDIAQAIRGVNMDLPGGQVKTSGANVSVRTLGEEDEGHELEDLVVRADAGGEMLHLNEVATIVDGFAETDVFSRFNGKPGVNVTVYKAADQDAIEIAQKVKALVAGKMHEPLQIDWWTRLTGGEATLRPIYEAAWSDPYPPMGQLLVHTDLSRFIEGRLDLLKRNGFWGLIFVFLSLLFFLNWRVAFWVMMGLLLAILGTLIAMQVAGLTLNLISMFGLIVVLGMLVDDAIIVGEHVYTKIEEGVEPELAAIQGADEVTSPVTVAIATTMLAFAPLLFIEGTVGDFMGVLPWIVIFSLAISLFEALTILPSHLADTFACAEKRRRKRAGRKAGVLTRLTTPLRNMQVAFIEKGIRGNYRRLMGYAVSYRYVTICAALGLLIVSVGLVSGGIVDVVFLQKMDAETLTASLEMPVGTPIERTDATVKKIEEIVASIPEVSSQFAIIGAEVDMNGGAATNYTNHGMIIIELKTIEHRDRSSSDILRELRERTASIPNINSLTFAAMEGGPGGAPIQIEISGKDIGELVAVTDIIKKELNEFKGVFDIEDDFDAGQREVQVELLDSGRALGLTTESLAVQVRAAFYGLEARKIQRDREDVKIMVRYPHERRRRVADLLQMRIATPVGTLVPISEVARVEDGIGYATIRRKNHERSVIVRADVDQAVTNAEEVLAGIEKGYPELQAQFAGVKFDRGGQSEEMRKAFGSLERDAAAAMILIYVVLAALFKSYIQPLIVMAAIPFGLIGMIIGHWGMGYPITLLSIIGLVALIGIVVNDSLILVSFINQRVEAGESPEEAVITGGMGRLRAIILTSITTILGLGPLLMETSFQAKFLIPMGISIAAGLAFATVLTLVVVPCLYVIVEDVKRAGAWTSRVLWPRDEAPEPQNSSA